MIGQILNLAKGLRDDWTTTRAGYLDKAISWMAPANTQVDKNDLTATRIGYLDLINSNLDAKISTLGAKVPAAGGMKGVITARSDLVDVEPGSFANSIAPEITNTVTANFAWTSLIEETGPGVIQFMSIYQVANTASNSVAARLVIDGRIVWETEWICWADTADNGDGIVIIGGLHNDELTFSGVSYYESFELQFSKHDVDATVVEMGTRSRYYAEAEPPATTLLNGLVAWWALEESTGTRVDSHGTYDLTPGGTVTNDPGVNGNCADFTFGSSSRLYNSDAVFIPSGDFTFALHVKFDNANFNDGVLSKNQQQSSECNYNLWTSGAGTLKWSLKNDTGTAYGPTTSVSDDTWYHVVCYYDASTKEVGMIVDDGTPLTATLSGTWSNMTNSYPLYIGNYRDTINGMNGWVDEVSFYTRLLTSAEITELASGSGYPGS